MTRARRIGQYCYVGLAAGFVGLFTTSTSAIDQAVTWDNGGAGTNWSTADNWSPAVAPQNVNPVDFLVTIPGTIFTVDHDPAMGDNSITELTLEADSRLNIKAGSSLTVLGTARLNGILAAEGGDFSAEFVPGEGSEDDPVTLGQRARVWAAEGAQVTIASQATYSSAGLWAGNGSSTVATFTWPLIFAADPSTMIDLSSITTIDAGFDSGDNDNDIQRITATDGGSIDLSGVTNVIGPVDLSLVNANEDRLEIIVDGGGSSINLDSLAEVTSAGRGHTRFDLSNGASLSLPAVTSLHQARFDLEGASQLLVNGASPATYSSTGFWAGNGSSTIATWVWNLMTASNDGTLLDLSSVTSIDAGFDSGDNDNDIQRITATDGGAIDLSGATTITAPADLSVPGNNEDRIEFILDGGNSSLDLSALTEVMSANRGYTRFNVTNGGNLSLPAVESLAQTRFDVSDGAQLHANGDTPISYSATGFWGGNGSSTVATFVWDLMSASGEGSLLDLSSVTSIDAGFNSSDNDNDIQRITASDSATIDLSGVTSVIAPVDGNDRFEIRALGGTVDLSSLSELGGGGSGPVQVDITEGGSVSLGPVSFTRTTTITMTGASRLDLRSLSTTVNTPLTLDAGLGSEVHIAGDLSLEHKTAADITLEPAVVHFDGDHGDKQFVEVGSLDFGLAGPILLQPDHFGMGQMVIGTADQTALVQLVDFFANSQPLHTDPLEALYLGNIKAPEEEQLEGLIINAGSTLFTGTLSVYANVANGDGGFDLVSINEEFEAAGTNRLPWGEGMIVLSGDMNDDGVFDAFDVAPFELALADPDAYLAAHPDMDMAFLQLLGDLSGDSQFDAFDVSWFELLLAGARPDLNGAGASVPEPAASALLGLACLLRRRRSPWA